MESKLYQGDCLEVLKRLESGLVQTWVTSPPYYGVRDYGVDGQIGLEETPDAYINKLVEVFREVKRVLKDDGTLWVNLGDSYWGGKGQSGTRGEDRQEIRHENGVSLNRGYQTLGGKGLTRPTDGKHGYTRQASEFEAGLSPRAVIGLLRAAQAWALMHSHAGVLPDDVQAVLPSVVGDRLAPRDSSRFRDAGQVGQFVLESGPVP